MESITDIQTIDWAAMSRQLFDESDRALFIFHPSSLRVLHVNEAARQLFEKQASELLGLPLDALLQSDDDEAMSDLLGACRAAQSLELADVFWLKRDDKCPVPTRASVSQLSVTSEPLSLLAICWQAEACQGKASSFGSTGVTDEGERRLRSDFIPIADHDGVVRSVIGMTDDATESENISERLRKSEEIFRQLTENINAVFWMQPIDADRYLYISHQVRDIWGRTWEQVREDPRWIAEAILPGDRALREQAMKELRKHGTGFDIEYRIRRSGGQQRWIRDRGFVIHDQEGKPIRLAGLAEDVTSANAVMEQLRIQDRAISFAKAGIVIADARQETIPIIYCNDAFERMTGYTREEAMGHDCSFLQRYDQDQPGVKALREALSAGRECSVVMRNYCKDGTVFWNDISVSPVHDSSGNITHLVGCWNDISERVAIESKLRDSEHRFRTLCKNAPMGVFLTDVEGDCIYVNQKCAQIAGLPPDQCMGWGWTKNLHPDDKPRVMKTWADAQSSSDGNFDVEARFVHADSNTIWVHVRGNPRIGDDGKLVGYVGSVMDITERKLTHGALEQSERRYRSLVEQAPEAIMVVDFATGQFVDWNEATLKLFQIAAEAIAEKAIWDFFPERQPDGQRSIDAARIHMEASLAGESPLFEWIHVDLLGREIPCEVRLTGLTSGDRQFVRGTVTDITERKQVETLLASTQFAVDNNISAIVRINRDGQLIYVNESACQGLQYDRDELLSMHVWDINTEWTDHEWPARWQRIRDAGSLTTEAVHQRKDGSLVDWEVTACYVNFDGEDFVFAFCVDVTQRKEAQQRLRQREAQLAHVSRLSTMGEMVAGIAHEVNQPLYSILNFAKASNNVLAKPTAGNLRQVKNWNSSIRDAATRAGGIIKRLRLFVSREPAESSAIDIDTLIEDAMELVVHEIKRAAITVHTEFAADPSLVFVDRVQTQQVLVNLLVNAIEAMDQIDPAQRVITITTRAQSEFIEVSVSDVGPGFPQDSERNYFDAFVSTKNDGMGMGLAISKTIVESFGGQLSVVTNPQGGATFIFTLPRAEDYV